MTGVPPAGPDPGATELVGVEQVEAAQELLRGVVHRTPLQRLRPLSERVGGDVWLKCENLQRAGSFKVRGAYVRLARLTPDELARGVVAASAGNHAQGVALAAGLLGAPATVFMPVGAPLPKLEATRAYGAEVRQVGATIDEALVAARNFAAEEGRVLVHPFDHPDVIAGQGTVGLEVLEQLPDVRTVVVCTGGGGLVSGTAAVLRARAPHVRVVAAQAAGAASMPASVAAGRPVPLERMSTMADGIAVGSPSTRTLAHVMSLVDEVVTVEEESLSAAVLLCLERGKLLVEPAGAAAVAALLEGLGHVEPPVVAVLSGGNVDPLLLSRLLQHGLAAAGRFLRLRLRVPDRPGALAALLAALAEEGANVLDVAHRRTDADLTVDEVDVEVALETRGAAHSDALRDVLRRAGYTEVRAVPAAADVGTGGGGQPV